MNFAHTEPHRVLIDGPFLVNCLRYKISPKQALTKVYGGRVTPMVTQCLIEELRLLGPDLKPALDLALSCFRQKCGHCEDSVKSAARAALAAQGEQPEELESDSEEQKDEGEVVSQSDSGSAGSASDSNSDSESDSGSESESEDDKEESEEELKKEEEKIEEGNPAPIEKRKRENRRLNGGTCILRVIGWGNQNKYSVATNDRKLQDTVRGIPGCPLFYVFEQNVVMDTPSRADEVAAKKQEAEKQKIKSWEKGHLKEAKRMDEEAKEAHRIKSIAGQAKRKHKVKGVNPLACKKKIVKPQAQPQKRASPEANEGPAASAEGEEGARKRVRIRKSQTRNKIEQ